MYQIYENFKTCKYWQKFLVKVEDFEHQNQQIRWVRNCHFLFKSFISTEYIFSIRKRSHSALLQYIIKMHKYCFRIRNTACRCQLFPFLGQSCSCLLKNTSDAEKKKCSIDHLSSTFKLKLTILSGKRRIPIKSNNYRGQVMNSFVRHWFVAWHVCRHDDYDSDWLRKILLLSYVTRKSRLFLPVAHAHAAL